MEIWKTLIDYPNYEISNMGKVRNSRGRIMKQRITRRNYKEIGLRDGTAKQKFFLVHRLVAKNFLEHVDGKRYVNHIDGDTHNNQVSNLEWVTQSENQLHAYKTGLQEVSDEQIERLKMFAAAKRRPIRVVNEKIGMDREFESIAGAAKHVDCNEKTLRNSLKNRNKSRLGYEVTYL
ncbi:HNH endonuclease [Enterococcus hermanniensis]|uniref:Endodeoxyribonuclease n=1 Tax=Enterococcus hermanniensis TaxID=249189 RepID=A0A1L8TER6_9ENTE|nr:HNH endonuclease [Enterococcus hermanniensis]OJG42703.1 endodeoxyribonuclease [Enterococcus hermanniensis]